jgi:hypothetical protein
VRHVLLLVAALGALASHAGERSPFLHVLAIDDTSGVPLGEGERLRLVLELNAVRAPLPNELVRRGAARREGTRLVLEAPAAYPRDGTPAQPAHSRATFVLDWDEPAVKEARAALHAAYGTSPAPAELARFVDGWVRKTYRHAFDIASEVARRREGDCTELAVLLAALARASGRPARVVTGIVLTSVEGHTHAFGHAWAEVYTPEGWTPVDAALHAERVPLRYLPLSVLEEGPGFLVATLKQLGTLDVQKVHVTARP